MSFSQRSPIKLKPWQIFLTVGFICYPLGVLANSAATHVVSQKGRAYAPGNITIKAGETLQVVNDDIFLHHVFIDEDAMKFDSGSMDEGESVELKFEKPGEYQVKCAIHPKMNLDVTVE